MSKGVEWAAHSCILLGWIGEAVPAAKLAEYYQLPPVYLNKQLQELTKADILRSGAGPRGGFQLARPLEQITLWDVVAAVEGEQEAFRCTEIRSRAGGACLRFSSPCSIAVAMHEAELAWRDALARQPLSQLVEVAESSTPDAPERVRRWFKAGY